MFKKLWQLIFGDIDRGHFVVEWRNRDHGHWYGWQSYDSRSRAEQELQKHANSEQFEFRIKPYT